MKRAHRIRLGIVRVACACSWVTVTTLLLSSNPGSLVGLRNISLSTWSTVAHVSSFLLLTGLTMASRLPLSISATLALLVFYGVSVELLQGLVPNRYVSLGDFVANLLGIAIGATFYAVTKTVWRRRRKND